MDTEFPYECATCFEALPDWDVYELRGIYYCSVHLPEQCVICGDSVGSAAYHRSGEPFCDEHRPDWG